MTLSELGAHFGTDKGSRHSYLDLYEELFEPLRDKPISLLEMGLDRGASLNMWAGWFPNVTLSGLDNDINSIHWARHNRYRSGTGELKTFCGEQDDEPKLRNYFDDLSFDIIIDDAGHDPVKQILSFHYLWRCVKPGGFYIVEDVPNDSCADYWEIPGATVYRNHKNGVEDDILVVIKK